MFGIGLSMGQGWSRMVRLRLRCIKTDRGGKKGRVGSEASQEGSGKAVIGTRRVMDGRDCSRKVQGKSKVVRIVLVRFRDGFDLEWHRADRFRTWQALCKAEVVRFGLGRVRKARLVEFGQWCDRVAPRRSI